MKTLVICCLLLLVTVVTYAQDLIITREGDIINCKITKQQSDFVYFIYKQDGEVRHTLLPVERITKLQKDYFSIPDVALEDIPKEVKRTNYIRFAIDGGWGYRTAKVYNFGNSEMKDYLKKLRSGFSLAFSLQHYWGENWGAGIDYSLFRATHSQKNLYTADGYLSNVEDNINIQFLGPACYSRIASEDARKAFYFGVAMGCVWYVDKGKFSGEELKITGASFGMNCSVAYDIAVAKHMALGFKLSTVVGTLSRIKYSLGGVKETIKLPEDEYESLSYINLCVGIRFMGKTR